MQVVGRDRLVLDLSCRLKDGNYVVMTDRWQHYTELVPAIASSGWPNTAANSWCMPSTSKVFVAASI